MADQEGKKLSFPEIEERILAYWIENEIFKKSIDPSKKAYSFYDGPPFATGLPHYGHLLASTLKDIVPRYWTMQGYQVQRRWGWDCHGLPIEQEIDKKHHFKSNAEIEKFGIAKYNEECRSIVSRFTQEWEKVIGRLGRWADFQNDYKTMDRDFMESVWWVFHELWKKNLIYRGYKVMAFSTALGTPLSNFEAGSNYMDVQDPAITISLPLKKDPSVSFLAWTTTPWTLPSNLALAVGEDLEYVQIKTKENQKYILAEALIEPLFKRDKVEIVKKYKGKDLVGESYEPLFDFFANRHSPNFTVITSDHVTLDSGTGIVHMAPAFGEEDFYACKEVGIQPVCPVDNHGRFTDEVPTYAGQYVKEADKQIIKDLKAKRRLIRHDTIKHAYPFCPRTDTPLIYKAVSSWFVAVEKIKDQLIQNNLKQTHWVPEHLREGRFGKWLENARDWAISRNRFWGNPLPVWESYEDPEDQRQYVCVGQIEELEKLASRKLPDIHREFVDGITFTKDGKKYRRVPEVLDCWFESGSMPYAQSHYPFENKESFTKSFPSDFIAEGLDQTRGWFYTLSVLGTILFDKIPFQNVVVNGLILAEDGKKMSKRLKNYPDPMKIMHDYGADALRLYLIDSPVIRAEELRFSERGVKEIVRKVLLKLWNAYSFFDSYAKIDGYKVKDWKEPPTSHNILDRWIVSRMQSLLKNVEREMALYHLYNVVPEVLKFIDELTNNYIRLNRARYWGEGMSQDKQEAFDTLHYVLLQFVKVMAPFTPFLSEHLYRLLTDSNAKESVHLESFPKATEKLIDPPLEKGVALLEEVILLSRSIREREKIKVKIPLKELVVVHRKAGVLKTLEPLEDYLKIELNVRKISYNQTESDFVQIQVKPNGASLGPRAGKRMREVSAEIAKLNFDQLQELDEGKALLVAKDFEIRSEDVKVQRNPIEGRFPTQASSKVAVALDTKIDRDQELEGLAREVVNRVQNLRKTSDLQLNDRIRLQIRASGDVKEAVESFKDYIQEQTLCLELEMTGKVQLPQKEPWELEGQNFEIGLQKLESKAK